MSIQLKNFLRFWLLIAIQVLLLNKLTLRWWTEPYGFPIFVPYIYPLFILLLPFETPVWLLLLLGMGTGITIDTFMTSGGMHAFATVLIAYLRTNVLSALLPKNLEEYPNQSPNVKNMGWIPFLTYAAFLLVIHHTSYFLIEHWSFANFGYLMLKVLVSTLTSILFVVAYLLLFTRQVNARN
jgi:hypothetical protein